MPTEGTSNDISGNLAFSFDSQVLRLSTNYIGGLSFGSNSNDLYTVGFDTTQNNIGSVLAYNMAKGNSTTFTGSIFINNSLVRAIGIVAVPLPVPEKSNFLCGLLVFCAMSMTAKKKRFYEAERN